MDSSNGIKDRLARALPRRIKMSRPMDEPHLLSIIWAYKEVKRWQEYTPGVTKSYAEKVRLDEILKYRLERALIYVDERERPTDG